LKYWPGKKGALLHRRSSGNERLLAHWLYKVLHYMADKCFHGSVQELRAGDSGYSARGSAKDWVTRSAVS